jgi:hypothetical protein
VNFRRQPLNCDVPLSIGAWIGDGKTWSSSNVDDVRVDDTVLTAAEVAALVPGPATAAALGAAAIGWGLRRRRNVYANRRASEREVGHSVARRRAGAPAQPA